MKKIIQLLSSTSIKLYGQYAHTSNSIIHRLGFDQSNGMAMILKIYSASLQQSPGDGTYSVDF